MKRTRESEGAEFWQRRSKKDEEKEEKERRVKLQGKVDALKLRFD